MWSGRLLCQKGLWKGPPILKFTIKSAINWNFTIFFKKSRRTHVARIYVLPFNSTLSSLARLVNCARCRDRSIPHRETCNSFMQIELLALDARTTHNANTEPLTANRKRKVVGKVADRLCACFQLKWFAAAHASTRSKRSFNLYYHLSLLFETNDFKFYNQESW